ncbi:hypothetical protein [Flavivirga rizhaonensis]|uniref:hypothetical protein n=1 Tax=Flavivirga rizhaonensis TaxID=2559571 RepID=UPI001B884631|nr:hypothetical protein [Flavivirga rizhaonensis]
MYFVEKRIHLNDFLKNYFTIGKDINPPNRDYYEKDFKNYAIYVTINDINDIM